jgi:hypothetical protein
MAKVLSITPVRVTCISCGQKMATQVGTTDKTETYSCLACQVRFTTESGYAASLAPYLPKTNGAATGQGTGDLWKPASNAHQENRLPSGLTLTEAVSRDLKAMGIDPSRANGGGFPHSGQRSGSFGNPLDAACARLIGQVTPEPLQAGTIPFSGTAAGLHQAGHYSEGPGNVLDVAVDRLISQMQP